MDILNRLAAKAKKGDQAAFAQLFDLLADPIYRFLAFRLNNPEDAKEMASQVFLEAWQGLARYDPKRSFKAWIFSIARYTLIDFYRRHRAESGLDTVTELAGPTDIQAEVGTKTEIEQVLQEVNRLPELYQTVLKLKFVEELDYAEIAELTGKTKNSLRVIVKRGLDKLRDNLNHD